MAGGRDSGYVVPADNPSNVGGFKKKCAGSRSWLLLDATGREVVWDADSMHRVQIHAGDLRILDHLLSHPFAILERERAIVLNLEHLKAIITADEVLLRDPFDDNVVPVVEVLRRRLKMTSLNHEDHEDGNLAVPNDVETTEEDDSLFEFIALEVALEAICSYIAARTIELETDVYPALDMLLSKISNGNLVRVYKLRSQIARLTARVHTVRDELEQLLDDGDEDLEMLLEAYFMQIDGTFDKLTTLWAYIDNTEDDINIQLDNHQNQLIQLEVFLNSAAMCWAVSSLVAGIFSMIIP